MSDFMAVVFVWSAIGFATDYAYYKYDIESYCNAPVIVNMLMFVFWPVGWFIGLYLLLTKVD